MAHDDTVQIAAASPARRRALARMWRERESGRHGGETSPIPAMAERRQHARVGGSSRRRWHGHIETKIGNPTFRAAGITAYLEKGGTLEKAATMANHGSASTMLSWW